MAYYISETYISELKIRSRTNFTPFFVLIPKQVLKHFSLHTTVPPVKLTIAPPAKKPLGPQSFPSAFMDEDPEYTAVWAHR